MLHLLVLPTKKRVKILYLFVTLFSTQKHITNEPLIYDIMVLVVLIIQPCFYVSKQRTRNHIIIKKIYFNSQIRRLNQPFDYFFSIELNN